MARRKLAKVLEMFKGEKLLLKFLGMLCHLEVVGDKDFDLVYLALDDVPLVHESQIA